MPGPTARLQGESGTTAAITKRLTRICFQNSLNNLCIQSNLFPQEAPPLLPTADGTGGARAQLRLPRNLSSPYRGA